MEPQNKEQTRDWSDLHQKKPFPLIFTGFEDDDKMMLHCNILAPGTCYCYINCVISGKLPLLSLSSHFVSMWRPEIRTNMTMA